MGERPTTSIGDQEHPGAEDHEALSERGSQRSRRPASPAFKAFIAADWDDTDQPAPQVLEAATFTSARRAVLSGQFAGDTLVLPAGQLKVRSNDTDFRFRPHSAFAYYTGLGSAGEPDSVLVFHATDHGHDAVLYIRPRAPRNSEEFYADARYGELWVGPRPTLDDVAAQTGIQCRHIDDLGDHLAKDVAGGALLRVVPGSDPAVEQLVRTTCTRADADLVDAKLAEAASEQRLVKDDYEIAQMKLAIEATTKGFEAIIRDLPNAVAHPRGERVVESSFATVARCEGNDVGYGTIAAAGHHACVLHWVDNHGPVRPGELLLVDAGVEVDSLYTADVTRTLPINGVFTETQVQVYNAVLAAADAAIAVIRPGVPFKAVHDAAMQVIAQHLHDWGLLPVSVEESLDVETGGQHRRWMVHGTSHHLGIDVHDCAQARKEFYVEGTIEEGMVFTVEPGLYFMADDLKVPEHFRGIGVRIEDNIVVRPDGAEVMTAHIPRRSEDVESWMLSLRKNND